MTNIILSFLTLLLITCNANPVFAWNLWGSSDPLLTINGQDYQVEDYLDWWREWRENDQLPTSADAYIDWLLQADEARHMQLQDKPRYQQKVSTFLKVRSLMLLKQEEVDAKVVVPDNALLHTIYLRDYAPRWELRTVTFKNHADLNKFISAQTAETTASTEDILADLAVAAQDYTLSSAVWERPSHLPEPILNLVQQAHGQRFSVPYPWQSTWQIIEILTTQTESDEDFNQLRDGIQHRYLKQQRGQRTAQLMKQLQEKYPIQLDKTLLEAIHYEGAPEEQAQQAVLELLSAKISAEQLHSAARKQYDTFAPQQKSKIAFEQTLQRVISGIISQNLTNAEALNRHYEQRAPFKSTFNFYRNNRLVKELEQQLILSKGPLKEGEFQQRKAQIIQQLRQRSTIDLNQQQWQRCLNTLTKGH